MSLIDALLLDPVRINLWVAKRTDGIGGSGTQTDPYDGSTVAKFDALMNGFGVNICVHLGPGEFQTAGYYDGISGTYWQAKAGMKVIGSGIDVTPCLVLCTWLPWRLSNWKAAYAVANSYRAISPASCLTFTYKGNDLALLRASRIRPLVKEIRTPGPPSLAPARSHTAATQNPSRKTSAAQQAFARETEWGEVET